jgi:hypothetical protein
LGGAAASVPTSVRPQKPLTTYVQVVNQIPFTDNNFGADLRSVRFMFDLALRGTIRYVVRMDNPT